MAQPLVARRRGSPSGGGSRGSPSRAAAAATTAEPTVSRFVASHAARDGGRRRVGLAGDGVEHARPRWPATRRRAPRRRGATWRRGSRRAVRGVDDRAGDAAARRARRRSSTSHARSRPSRVPATTLSVRLLDASRLAPWTPVHDTSPTAYSPAMRRRAVEPGRHAAARVVGGRGDRDAVAGRVDADRPARRGDRREPGGRSARPCAWRRGTRGRRRRRAPRPSAG